MSDFLNIGVSALLANQRALGTIGHNISNVNTEGYTRQTVNLTQLPPQYMGAGFQGKGVTVASVSRAADDFLTTQVRTTNANESRATAFYGLATQVDQLLGNGSFSPALQKFFTALGDVNSDPSSTSARQVFLSSAQDLVARFKDTDNQLSAIALNVNQTIGGAVDQINALTQSIADLNKQIVTAKGLGQGADPNDLLDQRDTLVKNLAKLVNVSTLVQDDGAMNVFMGSGQVLVNGATSQALKALPNPMDGARTEVAMTLGGVTSYVSDAITGGSLGGALAFRDQVLEPARNAMGRLAAGLAFTFNAQHAEGQDLNGALGGQFFAVGSPQVIAANGNTGAIAVTLDPNHPANLTTSDYRLRYDGTNFVLTRLSDGNQQTLTGGGPFNVDGMTITPTAAAASGDSYQIEPTKYVVGGMSVLIGDTSKIAIADPLKSSYASANVGNGGISAPQVLDITNASVLVPATLVFGNPPSAFQINGAGPLIPYTSGANIDVNGWRVQISGTPQAGDAFAVGPNTGGKGDNANGLLLAGLQNAKLLAGGTESYQDTYNTVVGSTATLTQQAQTNQAAMTTLRQNAEAQRDAQAGVNLDEEAANLLKYQQAYEAAAHIITTANATFDALMQALRA